MEDFVSRVKKIISDEMDDTLNSILGENYEIQLNRA